MELDSLDDVLVDGALADVEESDDVDDVVVDVDVDSVDEALLDDDDEPPRLSVL